MTLRLLKNVDESWRDVVTHPLQESVAQERHGPVLCVRGSGPGAWVPLAKGACSVLGCRWWRWRWWGGCRLMAVGETEGVEHTVHGGKCILVDCTVKLEIFSFSSFRCGYIICYTRNQSDALSKRTAVLFLGS